MLEFAGVSTRGVRKWLLVFEEAMAVHVLMAAVLGARLRVARRACGRVIVRAFLVLRMARLVFRVALSVIGGQQ